MTLIVGTSHWNGVCINSDTRVTNKRTGKYKDNAQKIAHIHGGVGMVACGERTSAIMVRETIRKHFDEFASTNIKFPPEVDLQNVIKALIMESFKDLRNHPINQKRPIYEVCSKGLIGVNIEDQPLTINREEAMNLVSIFTDVKNPNYIFAKYYDQIIKCVSGRVSLVIINEFHQHTLYKYKVKLYDDSNFDIYELDKVPFGKIIALGSGSEFDYDDVEKHVLGYVLLSEGSEDINNGAFHLGMIHEYAEMSVGYDKRFNFKTFGGANVAGMIVTDKNGYGGARVLTGDFGNKKTGKIISKTFKKDNKLWVVTRDGEEIELEPFPDKVDLSSSYFWL